MLLIFFSAKYKRSLSVSYPSLTADWWIQKQIPAPIRSKSGSRCRFSTIRVDDPFHVQVGTIPSQLFGLSCVYVWVRVCMCQTGGGWAAKWALSDISPVEQEVCGEWIEAENPDRGLISSPVQKQCAKHRASPDSFSWALTPQTSLRIP